jgi:hypothetical protein
MCYYESYRSNKENIMIKIYKYTDKRAKDFRRMMFNIPARHKESRIIFAYGDTAFKFIVGKCIVTVSRYDEEIVIQALSTKKV